MDTKTITTLVVFIIGSIVALGLAASEKEKKKKRQAELDAWAKKTAAERERVEALRRQQIKAHIGDWGVVLCQRLLEKEVALEMTKEMVQLSWGKPTSIDQQEITKKADKERWVYGQPRHGAKYVWFVDSKVSKIKAAGS